MVNLIDKAREYQFTSLAYADAEDMQNASLVVDSEDAIFMFTRLDDKIKIDWAANAKDAFLSGLNKTITSLIEGEGIKDIEVDFIPVEYLDEMSRQGFEIVSEWVDFWKNNMDKADIKTPGNLRIDEITDNEYDKASAITKACKGLSRGYYGETAEWLREWHEAEHSNIFVAKLEDSIVGVCCVSLYGFESEKGAVLWLREVAVTPEFHSKKIGLNLICHALDWGRACGAKRSFLACDMDNRKGISLYEGLGYEKKVERGQINMRKSVSY